MYSCRHVGSERGFEALSALSANAEGSSEQRLRCCCPQADKNFRLYHPQFGVEPRTAGLNLRVARLFVNAPLAAFRWCPLEMLDHIRYVHFSAVDSSLLQRLIQELAGRTNKGMASPVFLITGLLAHEHDLCPCGPFAEHGLCSVLPEVTGFAVGGSLAQLGSCAGGRNRRRIAACHLVRRLLRLIAGNVRHRNCRRLTTILGL